MTSYWIKTVAVRTRVADNLIYKKNAVIWIRIQNYVTPMIGPGFGYESECNCLLQSG